MGYHNNKTLVPRHRSDLEVEDSRMSMAQVEFFKTSRFPLHGSERLLSPGKV
jgi:hypothetical protein